MGNNRSKILVIGGAGFIGSNLVDRLLDSDYVCENEQIIVLDDLSTGKLENISTDRRVKFVYANICDYKQIEPYFKNADTVYHFAALPRVEPSIKDPIEFNKINVDGTLNVFWAAKENNVRKIVFSSSSSVYGEPEVHPTPETATLNPMSPYALQKLHGEQYAKLFCDLYDMNITCLRYFNVAGNREPTEGMYVPVIGIWLRQLKKGEQLTITGDGKQVRDFVNVFDVAAVNEVASRNAPKGYNVYNVGSGKSYELNEVIRWIAPEDRIQYIPARIEPKKTLADITNTMKMAKGQIRPPEDLKEYVLRELKKIEK
jgi:UDP-glucose 4-epimerase